VRHEESGTAGEQLPGVREVGGDHRAAGRDGLDEHPGSDLLGGFIRK